MSKTIRYIKRFDWIKKFVQLYLKLIINNGLNINISYNSFKSPNILQRKLIEKQYNKLKNLNFPKRKSQFLKWLSFVYELGKQLWYLPPEKSTGIGGMIFLFYMIEINATILINKDPKKEKLSHRKIRQYLLQEFEKIGWANLIFPFSLTRDGKGWNVNFKDYNLSSSDADFLNSIYYGSRGREFLELRNYWIGKNKKKKVNDRFYVYFYDLFYKYSESVRYRPIIPKITSLKEKKDFNLALLYLFTLILIFWEVLLSVVYPFQFKNFIRKNLDYRKYYEKFQISRWKKLLEIL